MEYINCAADQLAAPLCTSSLFLRPRTASAGSATWWGNLRLRSERVISPLRRVIVSPPMRSPAPGGDQLCRRHTELFGALLDGLVLIDRLDLAGPNQPMGRAVHGPRRWRRRLLLLGGSFCHAASIGQAIRTAPPITGCKLPSSRLRKRLPTHLRVSPRRVLQRRARADRTPSTVHAGEACRTTRPRPIGSRTAQARQQRGDRRHHSEAKASTAD